MKVLDITASQGEGGPIDLQKHANISIRFEYIENRRYDVLARGLEKLMNLCAHIGFDQTRSVRIRIKEEDRPDDVQLPAPYEIPKYDKESA